MVYLKAEGAPKKIIDKYKAFAKLYGESIKEKIPEEDWKAMTNINHAVKEAYDKITSKQDDEVAKHIMADTKRYEKERTEFNEKGYYTLKDGSKSTDVAPKSKKSKEVEDDSKEKSGKKSGPKKTKS